jgi:hypothetical protein
MDQMEAGCGSTQVLPHPVSLEPPFRPFGQKPEKKYGSSGLTEDAAADGGLHFIHVKPSKEDKNSLELAERFILSLPNWGPVSFEIVGHNGRIGFQVVIGERMVNPVISQAGSNFPYADIYEGADLMAQALTPATIACAYRLKNTHFLPLSLYTDGDPYRTLCGCLGNLEKGGMGALQVLFTPVTNNWQENIWRAAHDPRDPSRSPFIDLPQLPKCVEKKLSKQLFAVSLRMLASRDASLKAMETFLKQLASTDNGIFPIGSYPVESILARNTYVHGAIMNLTELAYFIHLPSPEVLDSANGIERATKSYAVPEEYGSNGPVLGHNLYRGIKRVVCHPPSLPNQHGYISGESGQGKSNLILSIATQRINRGDGVAIVDPHGKLVKDILRRIPKERINDLVYFNAGDFQYPMAINQLANNGTKLEKEHIRVDLLNFFEDLFEAPLGVNIQHTLNFIIITLLTRRDSTLQDIERLLIDKSWRAKFIQSIDDDRIRMFWEQEYPLLEKRGIVTAITNKLSPLILPDSTIAPMLSQRENKVDLLEIMNDKKIFLANISHGDIGKRNSQLISKLLVSKIQIAAMRREGLESYPDYYIFVDELQYAVCPTMADALSGSRKYRLHLWLANQMIEDIPDAIRRHIFNASTMIFFSTDSPHDRMLIEKTLSKRFTAEDIGQLKKGETLVKMGGSIFNVKTEPVPESPPLNWVNEIIAASRAKYTVQTKEDKKHFEEPKPFRNMENRDSKKRQRNNIVPPVLSPQEKAFLECAFHNPTLSVTALYKNQGLSGYMGDKLRTAVKDKKLLQEVTTHLGSGSRIAKFVYLTPEGFAALGIEFGPESGKGGQLHRYWQSIIKFHAESKGYRVTIEEPIIGSKETVDLGIERDGKRTAIEISIITDAENEVANIKKCLRAGYDKIVVLVLEEEKAKAFKEVAKKVFTDQELGKIYFCLVYGFGGFC